jgi:hypothetical protein
MGIIHSQEKSRQVTREEQRIHCTHTNSYSVKTTKWEESPHTSQYKHGMLMFSTLPSKDWQWGWKRKSLKLVVYKKPTLQTGTWAWGEDNGPFKQAGTAKFKTGRLIA